MIGEAPGKQEIMKGEPFIGRAGWVLNEWLIKAVPILQLAKERGEILYMNTLRCLPPETQNRAYPKGEERLQAEAQCRQYDSIPDSVHTVILFGESPQRAWFHDELEGEDAVDKQLGHGLKGVMGRIGRVYSKANKIFVMAPHPAFILRQPSLVQHGQRALEIAANPRDVIDVSYLEWSDGLKDLL